MNAIPNAVPPRLSDLIDSLFDIRERKRQLNEQLKDIEAEYVDLEFKIIARLQEEGTDLARSKKATASLTESVVPKVDDWDAFYQYIKDNDALYLLERRPSVGAFRELHQAGESIPGVEPFTKIGLNLRKL
jgi:macrodomain Ter protein organizer (MatP/YcbG family)